eukprot:TRINITY_DN5943_c0_g1_i2.p1 TRINITY_DN5943_c0_g1~~TRINITY_DN5943_c0_g1_i2.p1  ORF type:complete len:541 (+),score=104.60 TRINITY_DN5943_c0_g1_i2:49-1623(+)
MALMLLPAALLLLLLLLGGAAAASTREDLVHLSTQDLLKAYDAALVTLYVGGKVAGTSPRGRDATLVPDCYPDLGNAAALWPQEPTGLLQHVLDSGEFYVGIDESLQGMSNTTTLVFDMIAKHYNKTVKVEPLTFANDTALWQALDSGAIDCTDIQYELGGFGLNERRRVKWRPTCSVDCKQYHRLASFRGRDEIDSVDKLHAVIKSRTFHGLRSEIGSVGAANTQVLLQLFAARIYQYEGEYASLEAMRNRSTMLAAMISEEAVDDSLAVYELNLWSPLVAFCRNFVDDTLKVSPQNESSLTEWQTGNEALAQAYDAALMSLQLSGDYFSIFSAYNITSAKQMGDCNAKQSGYAVPTPTGTLAKVLRDHALIVGDIPYPSPLLNTSSVPPTGVLHAINLAVVNWITRQFDLSEPIELEYKLFSTDLEVYHALDNGIIDATANHNYPGLFTFYGKPDLMKNRYRAACTAGAADALVVVRVTSHITSLAQFYRYSPHFLYCVKPLVTCFAVTKFQDKRSLASRNV